MVRDYDDRSENPNIPKRDYDPRLLKYAFTFLLVSIGLLVVSVVLYYSKTDYDVLGEYSTGMVLTSLPGFESPSVMERDTVYVRVKRCVHHDESISVEVSDGFVRVDEPVPTTIPNLRREPQVRPAGCNVSTIPYPLPAGVTPGLWRIEGIERSTDSGEVRYWATEVFEVLPSLLPVPIPSSTPRTGLR
jgi:hypothetical protein